MSSGGDMIFCFDEKDRKQVKMERKNVIFWQTNKVG